MKLITDIKPRRDGVVVAFAGGKNWAFKADENGEIVGDVDCPEALAQLLATGNFQPYDEADLAAASILVTGPDADAEDDGEEAVGGLPIEAGTPPAAKPGKGRKAR